MDAAVRCTYTRKVQGCILDWPVPDLHNRLAGLSSARSIRVQVLVRRTYLSNSTVGTLKLFLTFRIASHRIASCHFAPAQQGYYLQPLQQKGNKERM